MLILPFIFVMVHADIHSLFPLHTCILCYISIHTRCVVWKWCVLERARANQTFVCALTLISRLCVHIISTLKSNLFCNPSKYIACSMENFPILMYFVCQGCVFAYFFCCCCFYCLILFHFAKRVGIPLIAYNYSGLNWIWCGKLNLMLYHKMQA